MAKGKVYIVGGGPGNPLLMTLKAIRVLQEADVVLYDHLVPEIALELFSKAEKVYVGKRPSAQSLTQDKINELLARYAKEGKTVVRLKGGDPFIFGRGGEECEYLSEHGVDFEVVPGISSFYSAPAYVGIPITHRDIVSSFSVATGSEAEKELSRIDFSSLAKSGTVVFLMAVRNLRKITEEIAKHLDDKTPCAIIQSGTTADQRAVFGRLGDIAQKAEDQKIEPPAVFIVGKVVELAKKLRWFEKKPLFGKKVVITRPADQSYDLAVKIFENGGEAILFPSVEIKKEQRHIDNIRRFCELVKKRKFRGKPVLVFTSQNGVKSFFSEVFALGYDSRIFSAFTIAAIGEKTSQALKGYGISPDIVPEDFSTRSLAKALIDLSVKDIIFLRAEGIRDIEDELKRAGKTVKHIDVYAITRKIHSDEDIRKLMNKNPDVLTFTSSLSFEYFSEMFAPEWMRNRVIACIGESTAKAAEKKLGKPPEIVAKRSTTESLLDEMISYFIKQCSESIRDKVNYSE